MMDRVLAVGDVFKSAALSECSKACFVKDQILLRGPRLKSHREFLGYTDNDDGSCTESWKTWIEDLTITDWDPGQESWEVVEVTPPGRSVESGYGAGHVCGWKIKAKCLSRDCFVVFYQTGTHSPKLDPNKVELVDSDQLRSNELYQKGLATGRLAVIKAIIAMEHELWDDTPDDAETSSERADWVLGEIMSWAKARLKYEGGA